MSRALVLVLSCLLVSVPLSVTRAQERGLRGATLYLTSSTASVAPVVSEQTAAAPYQLEPQTHHQRKGAYLMTVGVSLLVGALAHTFVLASVKHCGIERPNIIANVAIASLGIGFSFAGWRQLQLAPLGQRQLTPLTKAIGLPATALGVLATTAMFTGFGSFVSCFELN